MNSKYEQGRSQIRAAAKREREMWENGQIWCLFLLAAVVGMVLFGLMGCATTSPLAIKGPLVELGQPITITGLVQVGQMGEDCASQDRKLKSILRDVMVQQKVPAPQKIAVNPLSGSSLCGFSQGVVSELGTLELGARNTARAEVSLYWSDIKYSDLEKAQAVLNAMRPIAAVSKTAHNPAK